MVLVGLAGLQLLRAFTALFAPIVLDYCEMVLAGATEQLRQSGNLRDIYAPPQAAYGMPGIQYPPLFTLLTTALRTVTGLSPVLVERLLAWSLYATAAGLVGLNVWQEVRHKWLAALGFGLPFCFWGVIIFIQAARVDPLALSLSLLTAYLYRHQTQTGPVKYGTLALVAGTGVLAFFSKQTYLAVSAAIFFDIILCKVDLSNLAGCSDQKATRQIGKFKAKRLVFFCGCWLGWAGLGMALFGWLSAGELFGIFEPARAGSFIFSKVPGFLSIFVFDHLPLLLLALIGLWWQWRQGQRFWPLYSLFAALTCITIIKDGAVDYYFNELGYVLSVSVVLALQPGLKLPRPGWRWAALTLQALLAAAMFLGWSQWKDYNAGQEAYDKGLALVRAAQVQEQQGGKPGLVLVDSFLLETGQAQRVGDYFIYSVLLSNNRRDPQPLINDLLAGRYRVIITENFLKWPPAVEAALSGRYQLQVIADKDGRKPYRVYTLRPAALEEFQGAGVVAAS